MKKITFTVAIMFAAQLLMAQCALHENFPGHLVDNISGGGVVYDNIFVHIDDQLTVSLKVFNVRGRDDINRQIDIAGWCRQINWEHSSNLNSWQDFYSTKDELVRASGVIPQRYFKVRVWAWDESARRGATTQNTFIFDTEVQRVVMVQKDVFLAH